MDFQTNGVDGSKYDQVELFDADYGQYKFLEGDSPEAVVEQYYPGSYDDAMEVAASESNIPDVDPPGQVYNSDGMVSDFTEYSSHPSGQIGIFNKPMVNSPEYAQFAESCQLPSIHSMVKMEPTVTVGDVPQLIRFRYESEIKVPTAIAPEKSRNPIKMKVNNYQGNLTISVDLVVEGSHEPHINEIYLPKDTKHWMKIGNNGGVRLESRFLQTNMIQTYELPWYGVMRAKKDRPNGGMNARGTPDNDDHNKRTTRVVFRFTFDLLDINRKLRVFSHVVKDSKCNDNSGETKLVHINPTTCRCNDQAEVTILGDNFMAKSKVFFSSPPHFHKEASVVLRHKKQAMVVKVPQYCIPEGGQVKVYVVSGTGHNESESNPMPFIYKPETEVRSKRPAAVVVHSGKLLPGETKNKLKRMIQDRASQHRSQASSLQVDSCVEDYDEVDCSSEVPEEETEEDESVKSLLKIAFDVADSVIPVSERLCKILAESEEAMIGRNADDYTPLAQSIIGGKIDVVSFLLEYMPDSLIKEVLSLPFGERQRTHFLLTKEAKENALDLVNCLCERLGRLGTDRAMDVDDYGNSLLHLFILDRSEEDVEGLLKLSATYKWLNNLVDVKNSAMLSPLHLAVLKKSERMIRALLEAGADVNMKDQTNHTPLHLAVLEGCSKEIVTIFLDADGMKVNAVTLGGTSALDIAFERENGPLQDLLASRGAERMQDSEDDEDEEQDEEEDSDVEEEEEEEEEGEKEEAVDEVDESLPNISWEEMKRALTDKLTNEEFKELAMHLNVKSIQLSLLDKTNDKCGYFFVIVKESSASLLPSALSRIGKNDLAAFAQRLNSA